MTLFLPGETTCGICGRGIGEADDVVGTTHFLDDPADPLYAFSDALMHRRCFAAWERREAFVAAFNAAGLPHRMRPDGTLVGRDVLTRFFDALSWLGSRCARLRGRLGGGDGSLGENGASWRTDRRG